MKKILLLGLLLSLLLATSSFQLAFSNQGYCKNKCKGRCTKIGFPDKCLKDCEICCQECKCVPLAMFGNKHECPCYKEKKNNKGKSKCP